jgi:hypothetical protein
VISIGPIVGWGLDLLSGIVLLSSLVLKTDENSKKNVEKHIKIMSRTSSTHIYQATPKDSGASLKVNQQGWYRLL